MAEVVSKINYSRNGGGIAIVAWFRGWWFDHGNHEEEAEYNPTYTCPHCIAQLDMGGNRSEAHVLG